MAATDTAEGADDASGGSLIKTLGVLALLTLIAVGAGVLVGTRLVGDVEDVLKQKAAETKDEPAAEPHYGGETKLLRLPPIISNLASPRDTWVRLEASLVFEGEAQPEDEVLAAKISEDITTYLRTVALPEIEGASGLLSLREDLNDRVALRSEGRVRELVVETLVAQ